MSKGKFIFRCTDCGKELDTDEIIYLCPDCSMKNSAGSPPSGVLKIIYDYPKIKTQYSLFKRLKDSYLIDILPINSQKSLPNLRIGKTPLYKITRIDGKKQDFNICLKDDSQNPTFSFKDRASSLVSAFAKERNIELIVAASTGNAGSSLAGICASQKQKAVIIVPESAPVAKLTQIVMYGATIIPVKGTYDEAFDLSIKATEEFGWYNRNTAYNPVTIEGKKSVAFELFEDLGLKIPDRIFVPTGDGVIISGVYKGFEELYLLGLTDRVPVIVAVQAQGSDNLVRNLGDQKFILKESRTIADSISVDIPRNFNMAKQYIRKYNGESVTVKDDEILDASSILAKNTGIFSEPASAAAFAGLLSYQKNGLLRAGSENIVLLTGSGLKDLKSVGSRIKIREAIKPTIENLKTFLS